MVTQKNIVDRINQLVVRYNVTWGDIMLDADRAIDKINSFLGTIYPKMSDILDSPDRSYAFRSGTDADGPVDTPYFGDEHIYNVVVPFVAMEVLARDEEFTTIYNKYSADLEDGLFTMFQKEFNKVPLAYRQNPDTGVFFAADSAAAILRHNHQEDLPVYKFRIHYHINNAEIALGEIPFISDPTGYLHTAEATILDWIDTLLSADGTKSYVFAGWSKDPNVGAMAAFAPGEVISMITDVHLYADWTVTETLTCTPDGVVTIKDEYKYLISNLDIPNIVNNTIVRKIPTDFIIHTTDVGLSATNLQTLSLPDLITDIEAGAFNGFQGSEIIFPTTIVDNVTYKGITIYTDAFINTPYLSRIFLPANVKTIQDDAFPDVSLNGSIEYREIRCEILEQNKPSWDGVEGTGWHATWYTPTGVGYTVYVTWGYNHG